MTEMNQGLIHLYYGPGKGKTTAAVGQAVRAAGHDWEIKLIQFMKGADTVGHPYGEVTALRDHDQIEIKQQPTGHATAADELSDEERERLETGLTEATTTAAAGEVDLLVLDELVVLTEIGLVDTSTVLAVAEQKAPELELIITGREAPPALVGQADYVSYTGAVKHPYQEGVTARQGIEY
jgi:ATP:corrinoid adenosyltransferase